MRFARTLLLLACLCLPLSPALAHAEPGALQSPYGRWTHGPPDDPSYFPIGVWLQHPRNAARFKAAGINLYVGLHRGPTQEQLDTLTKAGMPVICFQNELGLANRGNRTIIGWMHRDEPDNAQRKPDGRGYNPPIPPEEVERAYHRMRQADPSRPVFLNLGQGVAWDNWIGRGVRTNHPEDYPLYVKGCDIASFDIYPAVHAHPEVAGKLEFVAHGVKRLVEWAGPERVTWNCIEAARIHNPNHSPTPHQVRAEVWMSIIHGSRGLIYFVHQFAPRFREAALFDDPELLAAVTRINQRIHALAPVLNSPSILGEVTLQQTPEKVPVAVLLKRATDATYLFAVGMGDQPVQAEFTLQGLPAQARAEVLDETRELGVVNGVFRDAFKPYDVHLYRIRGANP
jgi:hypothetical protein